MKSKLFLALLCVTMVFTSCKKNKVDTLGGEPSPIGEVGVTFETSTAPIAGVSSVSAAVVTNTNGVSSITGTAVITNATIKNILSNHPEATINGNNVTITGVEFKSTTEGIEAVYGLEPGVIVKYDSNVGDSYTLESGMKRTVVSKSTENDYYWGYMNIKAMEVEENTNKFGVKKIRYFANHRFGLVGMEFTFDDNSTAKFPIYASAENE